jgi:predicted membrane protein
MDAHANAAKPSAERCWARALSLAAAGVASLVLLLDPYVLRGIPDGQIHAGLPLMMFGSTGLFMHGLGFEGKTKALRRIFHRAAAWLLFATGMLVIAGPM